MKIQFKFKAIEIVFEISDNAIIGIVKLMIVYADNLQSLFWWLCLEQAVKETLRGIA